MDVLKTLHIGKPLAALPAYLGRQIRRGTKVMVLADSAIVERYGNGLHRGLRKAGFQSRLKGIPAGEKSKTLAQAGSLYRLLARERFERRSLLVALGGGVVGDLTGFVAATYLRGIPFVQVPTTLLAQVDAAIGGKTAVDIPEGKNLVGAFYHPQVVWIDPALLQTLPLRQWKNGLAEVIKYGAMRDAALFARLETLLKTPTTGYTPAWAPIIKRCAEIKADVVGKDPTETKGLRALLNFGHSVGHAIEAASGYETYLHGEAISIGMVVAGLLSEQVTGLQSGALVRLGTLLSHAGLPTRAARPIPHARLLEFLARDKKVEAGEVKFVLLKTLGHAVSGQPVSRDLLENALTLSGL